MAMAVAAARDWLAGQLGPLKREKFLVAPALGFYVLYSVGMAVFAVAPAVETGGWMRAALLGGFLGGIEHSGWEDGFVRGLLGGLAATAAVASGSSAVTTAAWLAVTTRSARPSSSG